MAPHLLTVIGVVAFAFAYGGMGMLWIWTLHTLIGASLSSPIVLLGCKRVHWGFSDSLAFFLPFTAWLGLMTASGIGKSLANLIEPVFISFAFPVAALIRVVVGTRAREKTVSIVLVALLCVTAAGVYWWTPALPE
jgi:hypothetical protein